MQGFFGKPVDNLHAEPLIARWIRHNVSRWQEAVVVSKNPGGTKRVTSLADALKLNFGIVTTDKRRFRPISVSSSVILERIETDRAGDEANGVDVEEPGAEVSIHPGDADRESTTTSYRRRREDSGSVGRERTVVPSERLPSPLTNGSSSHPTTNLPYRHLTSAGTLHSSNPVSSPLARSTRVDSFSNQDSPPHPPLLRAVTTPSLSHSPVEDSPDEYTDERARDVITGRLIQGHIVDDDYPSPTISALSGSNAAIPERSHRRSESVDEDPMTQSVTSNVSSFMLSQHPEHALGGTFDATASSDEEEEGLKNPELEQMITLVGNVRGRTVFIVDDMIDKPGSWIAAAECVVKRGGAKKVFCIATHGLFGDDCLAQMEAHECIDYVSNSIRIAAPYFFTRFAH
jgi:ribose-phosphate pyrophosphokinase